MPGPPRTRPVPSRPVPSQKETRPRSAHSSKCTGWQAISIHAFMRVQPLPLPPPPCARLLGAWVSVLSYINLSSVCLRCFGCSQMCSICQQQKRQPHQQQQQQRSISNGSGTGSGRDRPAAHPKS